MSTLSLQYPYGSDVEVTPNAENLATNEFIGQVVDFGDGTIMVEDQDGDVFDCDPDEVKLTSPRSIAVIAQEIDRLWKKVNYAARPYLDAMYSLDKITDDYGYDSGLSVVLYFRSNARSFTGPDARRIKDELKGMCK